MSSRCSCARLARLPTSIAPRPANINITRPFSTTTAKLNVPPEHPEWIKVPTPPQSQASEEKPPIVKGTLPTPRDVFPEKEKDRKVQPEYLLETAPAPTSEASKKPAAPGSRLEHRRRMAESRRENLGIALQGLYQRKQEGVEAVTTERQRRLREHQRAAVAPERLDDRLTRSSVLSSLAKTAAVAPDPRRYALATASKARTAQLAKQKSEARQDALMELYINASKFIVTEEELGKHLDQLFAEDFWKRQGKSQAHDADNAWDVWGQPPTVSSMLDDMLRKQQRAIDYQMSEQDRTVKRQKSIAEELTGGKME
ncbi:hypothetical protein CORC01_13450 [Colletotrichum orchidophilum]|uniref:Uncharacterized protein n=1 Tax=Colletotrichum orchidophilum TaxID=1209926 RepID=A0A1G4APZ9_9PEZI|nr:uncharacterized protein CORC01_13450 [Colletotrichum orchidophilum]OHE91250.1 hypothetical protein CORC01_13450 [Colletotrichum orchidophilum]